MKFFKPRTVYALYPGLRQRSVTILPMARVSEAKKELTELLRQECVNSTSMAWNPAWIDFTVVTMD